jgi:hypothetical protein
MRSPADPGWATVRSETCRQTVLSSRRTASRLVLCQRYQADGIGRWVDGTTHGVFSLHWTADRPDCPGRATSMRAMIPHALRL